MELLSIQKNAIITLHTRYIENTKISGYCYTEQIK